jgi:hypothetical protein
VAAVERVDPLNPAHRSPDLGLDRLVPTADLSEVDVISSDTSLTNQVTAERAEAGPKVVRA